MTSREATGLLPLALPGINDWRSSGDWMALLAIGAGEAASRIDARAFEAAVDDLGDRPGRAGDCSRRNGRHGAESR